MAYQQVMGQFKERGDESVKHLPSITEFAEHHILDSIMRVGSTNNYWVSVVTYKDKDNNTHQQMVKHGTYDLMDFTSEEEYYAYENMVETVRRTLGAYSHTYKVGAGYGYTD